ncbi:LLM class flavin-dependent oxidoreductase [Conexibacter sp. JD483]|uniref:LLM class flavin-dependent oxidoreductase n=1 Tax=unclassified Conexibacter TaxID=2627773 RepID=UPI0027215495|nr:MULTISPECIES: LLM class flavin-dependent oxidoreductase [unclassified Conexibacter]MDO8187665.1 LLM class flavin-dependent oxidoreductase [Conexibacter sp. CPCC 205706]MDO8199850.1 LLM class flavin-dependent oxidoreductase [Conexibacter sp. CPCC 205762]MDR9370227.1 LLM class flavin-dependent oxidoreductase [Conexibacter sp. JD483]
MSFDVGVQVFPGLPRDAVAEAVAYERLGISSVWIADHFHGAGRDTSWIVPEVFTTLGAVAASTETLRFGTCVVSTTKRDPAVLAHGALTLSSLSGGRFDLGLGTGFGPDLHAFGIPTRAAVSRLEESLEVMRGLFASSPDRPFDHEGGRWQLHGAFLNLPDAAPPAVSLAAIGPRMLELTARHADGWLPFGLTPRLYASFLERIRPRAPGFQPRLWVPTFVEEPGEDRSAEAEASGRLYLSMAPQVLEQALGEEAAGAAGSSLAWSPERGREIAASIPRELALAVAVHGSPARCVEQLRAFEAAGCAGVVLRITDPARRRRDVERLAAELAAAG